MYPNHADIEVLAYHIWESQGWPEGRALEHWLEAEYLVRTNRYGEEEEPLPPDALAAA